MCGLVFSTGDRGIDRSRWEGAVDVLECRGPDARDVVHRRHYSAGQCRLEIIGLGEPGHQPYSQDLDEDVLVFNGEIYNFRELGSRYGIPAESDTQVLYHLLRRGLQDGLSELRGMFAFVYWQRQPQTVIAGRDYFGIKPLYLTRTPAGSLSFASVTSALVALQDDRAADPVAVATFLATGYIPSGMSAHRGIEKCPQGTITTWRKTTGDWAASHRRLTLDGWPVMPPAEALADSVQAHLVSDVPVGVLLSGGVDSTLVASMAAQQVERLRTYSLTNPRNPAIDESAYARWNAALIGTDHTEVEFDTAVALDTAENLVRSSGEPFGDAAFIPLAVLCERVAHDLKVVLAGEGADELFAGYRRYDVESRRAHGALRLPARTVGAALRATSRYESRPPSHATRTWAALAARSDGQSHDYLLGSEWRAVAQALPGAAKEAAAIASDAWSDLESPPDFPGLPAYRAFDLFQWLPNVFLEKSDRASMLHGVEVRVPFLDPIVARSSTTVHPQGSRKQVLRDELHRLLPSVRLPRRKMGLSVDTHGLLASSGLAEYARFELEDSTALLRTLEAGDMTRLRERARLNPTLAFRLGTLGIWEREFLG